MGCQKSLPVDQPLSTQTNQPSSTKQSTKPPRILPNVPVSVELGSINEHFKILKAIGTNISGTMLYAQDLQTGTFRAIKELAKSFLRENPKHYSEVEILKDLDHPNIIKAYQTIETPLNYYYVFEYLNGGDLKSKLKRSGNEISLSIYIKQVFEALNYIHRRNLVHCNVNPSNFLFTENEGEPVVKLVSFSNAQRLDDKYPVNIKALPYIYVSPELLRKNLTEKTDIWSLGIIIYEMLVGKHPYLSKDKHDIVKEILKGEVDWNNPNFTCLSFHAQDFIKKLLVPHPEQRVSAKEALSHPWLSLSTKEFILNYEAMMKLRNFKIKSNITREVLKLLNAKIDLKDHDIISVFKELDSDYDGIISKEEVVSAFQLVGIDASNEINTIMSNCDIDSSGALDFTEIKIALTDWSQVIKSKTLSKILKTENRGVSLQSLKHQFNVILPHEWNDFAKKTKCENGNIPVEELKTYLKNSLDL